MVPGSLLPVPDAGELPVMGVQQRLKLGTEGVERGQCLRADV